jgi:hypothetical protein
LIRTQAAAAVTVLLSGLAGWRYRSGSIVSSFRRIITNPNPFLGFSFFGVYRARADELFEITLQQDFAFQELVGEQFQMLAVLAQEILGALILAVE